MTATLSTAPRPPLVPSPPLIGSARELFGDPLPFFVAMFRRYGPIFRIQAAGRALVVIAGPEANLFMTRADGDLLHSRDFWKDFAAELGGEHMINASHGEAHSALRRLMKAGYSRSVALDRFPQLVAIAREHFAALEAGSLVSIQKLMQRVVTDQLGELMAGQRPGDYIDDVRRFLRFGLNTLVVRQWPRPLLRLPAFRRSKQRIFDFARTIVEARRARGAPSEPPDLIDDLIAAADQQHRFFNEDDLLSGALGPYIAGLDTVASTLTFLIFELLRHPDLLEALVAEADALPESFGPEELRRLPLLHGCVMETMRLYPIAGVNQRSAAKDFVFGGHQVRAGETVLIALGVSHYLPELFPEPQRFDPERYSPPRNEHRQRGAYAPFGVGAHTCLGAGLAEIQMATTIVTLLRTIRLAPDLDHRPRPRLDPTVNLGYGFRVEVVGQRR